MRKIIKNLSMQKKMMLSFAVPIVIIYIILNTVCYHFITVQYEEKIKYSMKQSSEQAVTFLNNYALNMQYLSNMVENSSVVQETLGGGQFGQPKSYAEEYREFLKLDQNLSSYEVSNPIYELGIYIPDAISYSSNHYYFYEESLLEDRADFDDMKKAFAQGDYYYAITKEQRSTNSKGKPELTMFKEIVSNDNFAVPLQVCRVSVKLSDFADLMKKANITQNGLVYLLNKQGQVLASSNESKMTRLGTDEGIPKRGEETGWNSIQIGNENYYMIRRQTEDVDWQMISLIPYAEYRSQLFLIRVFQYVMIAVIFLLVLLVSASLSRFYVRRLSDLRLQMANIQKGDINVQLPIDQENKGDEVDEIYRNFNFMVEEVRRLLQEHYRLGRDVKVSEIKALQSQINPHFLYNTLDLINWMAVDYGASDIESMVYNLSRFYRLSLNKGKSILTIEKELEHVQVYVNIEKVHFEQRIIYEVSVPEEIVDKACLNIILQPFVENAIVHGIAEHPEMEILHIQVIGEVQETDIVFHVKDDGMGMSEKQVRQLETEYMNQQSQGYGIRNINFRIKLCFGEEYGVTYNSEPGKGTVAHIRIPMMECSEAETLVQ